MILSWNQTQYKWDGRFCKGASRYDARIRGGGDHGKADLVREIVCILLYKLDPNADEEEGVKKSEHFSAVISGRSLIDTQKSQKEGHFQGVMFDWWMAKSQNQIFGEMLH